MNAVLRQGVPEAVDDVPELSQTVRARLSRMSLSPGELEFDKERARKVFAVLYDDLSKKYRSSFHMEDNAPQWKERPSAMEVGSPEHKVWLWSAASTDLRSESEVVYHAHRLLWNNERGVLPLREKFLSTHQLYTRDVLGWSEEDYIWALAKARFGNPKRNIVWWRTRAENLWNVWDGDPFQMFALGSIDALMHWKKKMKVDPLPGVGPKIASLIAIFFEEIGMAPVADAFPVDVHVQRLALALRVVVPTRLAPILNETLEQLLRPAIADLCREEGWSRIILSHAMWFRGNQGCTGCGKTPHTKQTCPVYNECQGAYSSRPYFKMGLWIPEAGPRAKGGSYQMAPLHAMPLFHGLPKS